METVLAIWTGLAKGSHLTSTAYKRKGLDRRMYCIGKPAAVGEPAVFDRMANAEALTGASGAEARHAKEYGERLRRASLDASPHGCFR